MSLGSKAAFSMTKSTTEADFSRGPPFIPACQSLVASPALSMIGTDYQPARRRVGGRGGRERSDARRLWLKTRSSTPN